MDRRRFVTSFAGWGLSTAAASDVLAEQKVSQPLSLSIVPSSFFRADPDDAHAAAQGVIRIRSSLRNINVAIRNRSSRTVALRDENNSRGFDNLHLEITALADEPRDKLVPLEKPIIVRRSGGVGWTANSPQVSPLPPGEILVREVELPVKKGNQLTRLSVLGGSVTRCPPRL